MKHDSRSYALYRPHYPTALYAELRLELERSALPRPWKVADIGAGAGQSIVSLWDAGINAFCWAIEPDPAMLAEAHKKLGNPGSLWLPIKTTGESTGLLDQSATAITVGSAYHWMDRKRANDEFLRVIIPGGWILLYEYQFPRSEQLKELGEWIRRGFNSTWKFERQTPRGNFMELTEELRTDPRISASRALSVPMIESLGPEEIHGLLFSQARAIAYLDALPDDEAREKHQAEVLAEIQRHYAQAGLESARYDYRLSAILLQARP